MSQKSLKQYQEKAVEELIYKSKLLLVKSQDKKTLVFQAPTGSGKTFMMSRFIYDLIKELENEDLCFVWVSIGKGDLHLQSYQAIKKELFHFPFVCLLEQEYFGSKKTIEKNNLVVVNWEKLRSKDKETGEWKNKLMKDGEKWNFREIVYNAKLDRRLIVMIIDESHSNATSERALELRDEIVNADLTIEMSATPTLREGQYQEKVVVQSSDVIDEGMIKKEIIINPNLDQFTEDDITSQQLILESAYNKRLELKKQYEEAGIKVNPLVLIQLPTGNEGEDKRAFVESFLATKGINYENYKLAIWLSEEKVNHEKDFVTPNTSEVEFLIFKQAIDTGWDCPRSQILVRFREIKSITFEIQTVGRILRMPEAKHYENDELNKAFVYLNTSDFNVNQETYNPNIIKSINVKRSGVYKSLPLTSYYRNRFDYGDITASFYQTLEKVLCQFFGLEIGKAEFFEENKTKVSQKIDMAGLENSDEIILNKSLPSIAFDQMTDDKIKADEKLRVNLSQNDLYYTFINLVKRNLQGFAPKRSIPIVKNSFYNWFSVYLDIKPQINNGAITMQSVLLNNYETFSKLIDQAVREYKPVKELEIEKKIEETETWDETWEIGQNRNYNPNSYKPKSYSKSLYQPCYLKIDSDIEEEFIKFLEKEEKVVWWWQNGNEHLQANFGIKYGKDRTFQPDFLVMFNDGKLGIFDTKASGDREDENKLKSEALQDYIKAENAKGKSLFGGLVIQEGGHFRINQKEKYKGFQESLEDWKFLEV
jgi:type III restriction enzyme